MSQLKGRRPSTSLTDVFAITCSLLWLIVDFRKSKMSATPHSPPPPIRGEEGEEVQ